MKTMPSDNQATAPHGRTPENTPLPGGGRWAWDDINGTWRSRDEQPAPAPAETTDPAQE